MEHPNPFELEHPEEKREMGMITGSKLSPEAMKRVLSSLPEEIRQKRIRAIAESLPPEEIGGQKRAGASYMGVMLIESEGYEKEKWVVVEVSFVGSLHASRTHRGEKEEGIKTNIRSFDSLKELLSPLNLTDVVRLRLGKQLWDLAKRRGLEEGLRLDPERKALQGPESR